RIPPEVWENIEEVAVFDDASKDETFELAVGYKTLFGVEKLTVLRNEKNLGYGGNQMRGYRYFLDRGFDVVVMLHGDGQYAPEVLADLYAPIVAGEADAVFGSRMMPDYGGPRAGGMPLYKFAGNKVLTGYANYFLGMSLTEFHSGYRAYSLHALRRIDFSKMTHDFHFDTQIIIKFHHQGLRIREVAIPTYYGNEICYVNGFKYAKDVFLAVRRYRGTLAGRFTAPEYAEFAPHYPLKESKNSSHAVFQALAGQGQDILDVGCGEGHFAARIAANGNRVVGIDLLPEAPRAGVMAQYVSADLDQGLGDADRALGERTFDLVMLQDVIEHLRNPERMLLDCRDRLRPHGRVAVSVPNVANITVRLALLFGKFEYTPRGILDRTHVRFFTRKTARQTLEACGYEVLEQRDTVMPLELVLGLDPKNPLMIAINRVLGVFTWIAPGLLGYQTVLVARPKAQPTPATEVQPRVYRPAA
ncbi:MAG: methyltransferase domain-containing protein, partial [Gemmataceae bacterium]|nr:methyltransferase domain-containing protein [Gemmataceae bacterium]